MHLRSILCLFVAILVAGCVTMRGDAPPNHPLEGEWSYHVDAGGTAYDGVVAFTVVDGVLEGTIAGNDEEGVADLVNLDYDAPDLTFEFDSDEYGLLRANLEVEEDTFSGQLNVTTYGMMVPMTGERISTTPQ